MRVGLEATGGLAHRFTGEQRYILELARGLALLRVDDLHCQMLLRLAGFRKRHLKPDYLWPTRWYCSGPWPLLPRCDVIHGLVTRLPRATLGAARVSTIHDLAWVTLPRHGSVRNLRNVERSYRDAARRTDRVIAVSHATKAAFLEYVDCPPERIEVVYHGISGTFLNSTPVPRDVAARLACTSGPPYFVAFGGTPRKNLTRLVEAFHLSSLGRSAELRIIGPLEASGYEAVRRLKLESRTRLEPDPDDEGMATLYRGSIGLLFPSVQEGFGLPILEAMACGVPVLTSTASGPTEVAGGHAILVDPERVDSIANGIDRMTSVSARALGEAAAYAKTFTWRRAAEQTLAIYRAVSAG